MKKRYLYVPQALVEALTPTAARPRRRWVPLAPPQRRRCDAQDKTVQAAARGTVTVGGTKKRVVEVRVVRAETGPARLAARFTAAGLLALMLTGCGAAALGKTNTNAERLEQLERRIDACGCEAAPEPAEPRER